MYSVHNFYFHANKYIKATVVIWHFYIINNIFLRLSAQLINIIQLVKFYFFLFVLFFLLFIYSYHFQKYVLKIASKIHWVINMANNLKPRCNTLICRNGTSVSVPHQIANIIPRLSQITINEISKATVIDLHW